MKPDPASELSSPSNLDPACIAGTRNPLSKQDESAYEANFIGPQTPLEAGPNIKGID